MRFLQGDVQLVRLPKAQLHAFMTLLHCLAVIKQAELTSAGLLEVVGNAEREKAATPQEAPLSEWEVTKIKLDYGTHLTTQVLLANSDEAKAALQVPFLPSIRLGLRLLSQ